MFTQGKWEYFEQKEWGENATYGCVKCGDLVIVNGCAPGHTQEQKDNCRLMAAAPELLGACEYAQKLIETARQYFPKSIRKADTFQLNNACATLGRAIAKAEGKI